MQKDPRLGEILVQAGVIDEFQLRAALQEHDAWGHQLGVTLVRLGFLEERDLVRALARQLELPIVSLDGKRVDPEVLALVPADFAEKHLCLPLFIRDEGEERVLYLGTDDPCDLDAFDRISERTGMRTRPVVVAPSELCEAIDRFYRAASTRNPGDDVTESLTPASAHHVAPDPRSASAPSSARDPLLRALAELLIEKGLISRQELEERLRAQPTR